MTNVKGTALTSTLRFVEERFGKDGLQAVRAELPAESRAILESGVLVSSWYPLPLLLAIMRSAQARFGAAQPDLYRQLGRASADYALTGVYRIFFRFGSPQFIISRAAAVWQKYYDTGEMAAVVAEKGHAVVEIRGFKDPAVELCERIGGWMERTLELSGAEVKHIIHEPCAARGGPVCRYEGWWT